MIIISSPLAVCVYTDPHHHLHIFFFCREEGGVVLTRHQAFHFKSGHVLRHFYERHQLFERRQGRVSG